MKRFLFPIGISTFLAAVFVLTVNADSTLTIPVPDKAVSDKQITLSFRIPPNTEPLTQKQQPKVVSRSSLIVWNGNPSPKMPNNDEVITVLDKFNQKGWVKGGSAKVILDLRPMDRYHAVRALDHVIDTVLDVAQAPNLARNARKINLVSTDIDDLRRMMARFSKELSMYGRNLKKTDKDLLMLQEQIKKAKSGILKVIKVEGAGDGSTIVHLNVE